MVEKDKDDHGDSSQFYALTKEEIEMVIKKSKRHAEEVTGTLVVDPSWFVEDNSSKSGQGEKFDQHFICGICAMVVMQPSECGKCQNCFCKKCMENWKMVQRE
jgi:hypothetical protein